nr:hypothetical protein CKG001_00790 [Bdellovibrio sp. CKG001]
MKYSENKSDKPVILLTLAAMLTAFVLSGCNSDSVEKYEEAKPIYTTPSYKVCTSRELTQLPAENEELYKVYEDWTYGDGIYFYVYGPVNGFGPAKVVSETLPKAAILMNRHMTAFDNCNEIFSCAVEREADMPPNRKKVEQACLYSSRAVSAYISDVHTILHNNMKQSPYDIERGRPTPAETCKLVGQKDKYGGIQVAGTSSYIEVVLTKGIESLDTMTDQSNAESFKSELKTLCGHYRQIDYCGLNKKEVYEACEKAFGTNQQ